MVFTYNTKLVGSTFIEGVQDIIKTLEKDIVLSLQHESTNKFDANAIKVYYGDTPIGYIPRLNASKIVEDVKQGKVTAKVAQVTGGVEGKEHVGVNLEITVDRPEEKENAN